MDVLDKSTGSSYNPQSVPNRPLAIKYGLIWAGASSLLILLGFLFDMDMSLPSTATSVKIVGGILGFAIPVVAVTLAVRDDRKQLGGFLTLGRAVGLGAITGIVAGVASGVFQVIYQYVINPGYQDQLKNAMIAEWEKQGLSEEMIETSSKVAFMFTNPFLLSVFGIIGAVFTGVIVGLIAGAIMKREPVRY